ncbi:tetratricopeptide repeat protein [Hansschlegelia zhihuaiae]|uniref:Ancillary SecYEG translocon subunit n=1 Tax=Hansschlegelia zhihuaiae TaxID=405005 RepID=A0A4Q0MMS4_9HYPH|nr:tetratricopeptide repeat protein [Hansschlegelia zhihuaiae]RXF74795.1 tetratricopeptide repeat protein [Hansschlegelia zhihuaiae]
MADIFQEVQEDLRRDRLKALWDRYGTLIVTVAVLVVLGVGGWRAYEYYQARTAQAAGDRYQQAADLIEQGKGEEAIKAFAALAGDGPAGYRTLARLREADETLKTDKAAALKLYQAIVADGSTDPMLRDAARIRGAYAAVDAGSRADVKSLAEPLVAPDGAWTTLAREALGLAAYKEGDIDDARRNFDAIVSNPEAPGSTRQRADLMLNVLPPAAPAADAAKPTN